VKIDPDIKLKTELGKSTRAFVVKDIASHRDGVKKLNGVRMLGTFERRAGVRIGVSPSSTSKDKLSGAMKLGDVELLPGEVLEYAKPQRKH
jgi:hypothetical protein